MRLFLLLALVAIIICLVVIAVPTSFLGVDALFWFALSFAFYLFDLITGGYVFNAPVRQAPPPA